MVRAERHRPGHTIKLSGRPRYGQPRGVSGRGANCLAPSAGGSAFSGEDGALSGVADCGAPPACGEAPGSASASPEWTVNSARAKKKSCPTANQRRRWPHIVTAVWSDRNITIVSSYLGLQTRAAPCQTYSPSPRGRIGNIPSSPLRPLCYASGHGPRLPRSLALK